MPQGADGNLKIGNNDIDKVYLGSQEVDAIYIGENQVWLRLEAPVWTTSLITGQNFQQPTPNSATLNLNDFVTGEQITFSYSDGTTGTKTDSFGGYTTLTSAGLLTYGFPSVSSLTHIRVRRTFTVSNTAGSADVSFSFSHPVL